MQAEHLYDLGRYIFRTILVNQELPIGAITAAIGSLFFLTLLYFRKNRSS